MDDTIHRLDDILQRFRGDAPRRSVFIDGQARASTVADFDRLVAGTVAWLGRNGIGPGDCIAVWLVNRIEWPALLFAAARCGVAIAAVNTRYRAFELEHILSASGAKLLILQPAAARFDVDAVLENVDSSRLGALQTIAVTGAKPAQALLGRRTVAFDPAGDIGQPPEPDTASDPDAPLIFFTTSGTTSAPKLVVHPQRTLALHALACADAYRFDSDSAFLAAMPLCGVFGLSTALAAVAGAATVHLMPAFDAGQAARRIARHGITHLVGSDDMFRRLLEAAPDGLRAARLCGFAAFTPGLGPVMRQAAECGLALCGVYGSSEVHAIFAVQPPDLPIEERLKAGGRPALDSKADVRVRDPRTGAVLGPYEHGDLEIRAPTNFIGYHANPEATEQAIDPEGYFRTGDVGYTRNDGTFVYVARSGDAIRLAGFLVDPAEIEDALKGIGGIADAQVVGLEHAGRMRPVAFVIAEGHIDEGAVIGRARDLLADFKVPFRVFTIDAFPVTESANGLKIQKAKLRRMALERLAGRD
jgi:fatty-acyl-CoA synthase